MLNQTKPLAQMVQLKIKYAKISPKTIDVETI